MRTLKLKTLFSFFTGINTLIVCFMFNDMLSYYKFITDYVVNKGKSAMQEDSSSEAYEIEILMISFNDSTWYNLKNDPGSKKQIEQNLEQ